MIDFSHSLARCLAHWIITQRTIHVVLPIKPLILRHEKPFPASIKAVGGLLTARRKEAGITREILSKTAGIPLHWLGRWERDAPFHHQQNGVN
jgi:hypothetical protein